MKHKHHQINFNCVTSESLIARKGGSKKSPSLGSFGDQYLYWIPGEWYRSAIVLFGNVFLTGV